MDRTYFVLIADKDELVVLGHCDVPDFMQYRYTTAQRMSANAFKLVR